MDLDAEGADIQLKCPGKLCQIGIRNDKFIFNSISWQQQCHSGRVFFKFQGYLTK
jgi:hypothetical protein